MKFNRSIARTMPYLLAAVTAASPVYAQNTDNNDDEALEEIVVTGIKSSLRSAQSQKENADTFLDAISAEDIGALPDRSVAEALQRLPGINITRFKKTSDPDRFSVEGAGVIIRGLPFVRSELNGRDVFSATGGRVLSFNDVSPELLGGVQVFKNVTADMIDGGISGVVNLITRKPLDTDGFRIAGTAEINYGDLAKEASPAFSLLASHSWEGNSGRFGVQFGYAQSELITRSDASQVSDPCYRDAAFDGPCFRVNPVTSGGVSGDQNFDESNFPPSGSVIVPKGAGVRTTGYERDRNSFSAVLQFESEDKDLLVTAQYLRADADLAVDEHAMLALVNDDGLFPIEANGSTWNLDSNGNFQSGVLSQNAWHGFNNCAPGSINTHGPDDPAFGNLDVPCDSQVGVPTEMLRFQRKDEARTEDFSLDLKWTPTDRLSINFEAQHVKSERSEDGIISSMMSRSDIFIDLSGETPDVEFRIPGTTDGSTDPNYFQNPDRFYHWFLLDSRIKNDGEMTTFRADVDYDFDEDNFFKSVRFGARWSDRQRVTRDSNFGNWGNLSAAWAWRADGSGPAHPVYASSAAGAAASSLQNPFAEFQRGNASTPVPEGESIYFGGENLLDDYLDGTVEQQAQAIADAFGGGTGSQWGPIANRDGLVPGTTYLPGEISTVDEITKAAYARADFGSDDFFGMGNLSGNIGVRYVKTTIKSGGELNFPGANGAPNLAVACDASLIPPGATLPGFCQLNAARTAEFLAAFTGETIIDDADIEFEHWLPSFNFKLEMKPGLLLRGAVSKGISRPDLSSFRTGGALGDNTNNLRAEGTLDDGPLFVVNTGNRLLKPVTAWNYDLSLEWYFADVGSLTASVFFKDFEGLITGGPSFRTLTSDSGVVVETQVNGPANSDDGSLKGFELAYQQTMDFLPGAWKNLGVQTTYTRIDTGELQNATLGAQRAAFANNLPFQGVSDHTVNFTLFYETSKFSARTAYNWRSEFLLTARDDIFPFSPIIGEATGQLDASIFYNVRDNIKVGIQAVNLLDEVTQTSQVVDFSGTQMPRTAFRNDRRFTLLVRFDF